MSVVIGGGSGFIGRHLSRRLRNSGYRVVVVSRKPVPQGMTWKDVSGKGLPEDCVAVVSMAGENLLNPLKRWGPKLEQEIYHSRIDTTNSLAAAVVKARQPPKVFVSTSGVAFYKPHPTIEYTEDSPGGDYDFLSRLTTDWEAAASLPETSSVRQVIIRSGVVLGRDGGMIQQIYYPFYFGVGGKIGTGKQWFPWIHLQDSVGIYMHAIENKNVSGVLNAVAPEPAQNLDFTQAFAKAMCRPALFPIPGFVMQTVFGNDRAVAVLEGQKVLPQRTLQSGYQFEFPTLVSACNQLLGR